MNTKPKLWMLHEDASGRYFGPFWCEVEARRELDSVEQNFGGDEAEEWSLVGYASVSQEVHVLEPEGDEDDEDDE